MSDLALIARRLRQVQCAHGDFLARAAIDSYFSRCDCLDRAASDINRLAVTQTSDSLSLSQGDNLDDLPKAA